MSVLKYAVNEHKHGALSCFSADFSVLYKLHPKLIVYKPISDEFLKELESGALEDRQVLVLEQRHVVMGTLCYMTRENDDTCYIINTSLLPIFSEKKRQLCFNALLDGLRKQGEFRTLCFDLFVECDDEVRFLLAYGFEIVKRGNEWGLPWYDMEMKL